MRNTFTVKILMVLLSSTFMNGCGVMGKRHDLSAIDLEAITINKKLSSIEPRDSAYDKSRYSWLQPDNKKEDCKVYIRNKLKNLISANKLKLFWDGDCHGGYAKGLGREFVVGKLSDEKPFNVYFLGQYSGTPGSVPEKYVEHDSVNKITKEGNLINNLYVKAEFKKYRNPKGQEVVKDSYQAPAWLIKYYNFSPDYVGDISFGYMSDEGKSKVTILNDLVSITRSVTDIGGISTEITRNIGDSNSYNQYSADTSLTPKEDDGSRRSYQVMRQLSEPGTPFSVLLNDSFYYTSNENEMALLGHPATDDNFKQLDEVEKSIIEISEHALHERLISLAMKRKYNSRICGDEAKVSYLSQSHYKNICKEVSNDLKVSLIIFLIDTVRKNKEELSDMVISAKVKELIKVGLAAPPPLTICLFKESLAENKQGELKPCLFESVGFYDFDKNMIGSPTAMADFYGSKFLSSLVKIEPGKDGKVPTIRGVKAISGSNIFVDSFGKKSQYNLQNAVDREKFRIDIGMQPAKLNKENIKRKAGGGFFQNMTPLLWEPIIEQ